MDDDGDSEGNTGGLVTNCISVNLCRYTGYPKYHSVTSQRGACLVCLNDILEPHSVPLLQTRPPRLTVAACRLPGIPPWELSRSSLFIGFGD